MVSSHLFDGYDKAQLPNSLLINTPTLAAEIKACNLC